MDNPNQIPQFEAPQPSAHQERAMRLAGRLLGAGKNADPTVTLDLLATDVGGYQSRQERTLIGPGNTEYVHKEAKPVIVSAAQDETTKRSFKQAYETAKDFDDAKGTRLESAVAATVNKRRATGPKANKLRGKVARHLVGKATKGVGTDPYLRNRS